jgi:hypothetical protein
LLFKALTFVIVSFSLEIAFSQTTEEFWPILNAHVQLPSDYRLLAFVGSKKGEEYPYQQLHAGLGVGFQWKSFSKFHPLNIDPDKEHLLVVGAGYERLQTIQSGTAKNENRAVAEAFLGFRPASRLLLRDRNRGEFRWVNGVYSTRYRNDLSGAYDIAVHNFRFIPYASAEVFYDSAKNSWNEQQYTAGVQWPFRHFLMLATYYLQQNCTTCTTPRLNVAELSLNVYFRSSH